jgi:hypothetical protein
LLVGRRGGIDVYHHLKKKPRSYLNFIVVFLT